MSLRQKISYILKYIIVATSLFGTILGLFTATLDGYSHWNKRLLYYTTQSNLWIIVTFLGIIILSFFPNKQVRLKESFYNCKYIFTVCIAMTFLVFCGFFGPLADESYRPWSFYSIIVHAITPILTFIDFYLDEYKYNFRLKHVFSSTIPAIIYYSIIIGLCAAGLDFGRGEPYPYFFLDLKSNAGLFGFTIEPFANVGTFWWILFFSIIMIGIAFLFVKTHHIRERKHLKRLYMKKAS